MVLIEGVLSAFSKKTKKTKKKLAMFTVSDDIISTFLSIVFWRLETSEKKDLIFMKILYCQC